MPKEPGKDIEKPRTGWDGKPLSEKDQHFYDTRDLAGYKGPLDQDGQIPKKGR